MVNQADKITFADWRAGDGTKEWSDHSYNICIGCEHECLYCHQKSRWLRFGPKTCKPGLWKKQKLNPNRQKLGAEVGEKGVVMFPSSHDITPSFLKESLTTIKHLLRKNNVLIVSKPHLAVIKRICKAFAGRKDDILFRFSIGSLREATCAFWEPGAPTPKERMASLIYAFKQGFQTSISVEPMLEDGDQIRALVAKVEPYVTNTIWIGKLDRIPWKHSGHLPGFDEAAAKIKANQTDKAILKLVDDLKGHSKIRWKDTISEVIDKHAKKSDSHHQNESCLASDDSGKVHIASDSSK